MNPTIDEFLDIFDEFNSFNSTKVGYYFNSSLCQVGKNAFGDCYAQAVYLMTAHNLTMSNPSKAGAGQKSSEKVGDISVSYNTGSADGIDAFLTQTNYGLQFIELRNSKVIGMSIVEDC